MPRKNSNALWPVVLVLLIGCMWSCWYVYHSNKVKSTYDRECQEYLEAVQSTIEEEIAGSNICEFVECEIRGKNSKSFEVDYFDINTVVNIHVANAFDTMRPDEQKKMYNEYTALVWKIARETARKYPLFGVIYSNPKRHKICRRLQAVGVNVKIYIYTPDNKYEYDSYYDRYLKNGEVFSTEKCYTGSCQRIVDKVGDHYCSVHKCHYPACNQKALDKEKYCEAHKCISCHDRVQLHDKYCFNCRKQVEARKKSNSRSRKNSSYSNKPQYGDIDVWDYYEMHKDEFKSYDDAEDAFWDDYE